MRRNLTISFDEEFIDRMDAARGELSRGVWIEQIVEGDDETRMMLKGGWRSPPQEPDGTRTLYGSAGECITHVTPGIIEVRHYRKDKLRATVAVDANGTLAEPIQCEALDQMVVVMATPSNPLGWE